MRIVPLVLVLASATSAAAQEKVGFANLELIFTLMPEAQEVTRQLETYQKELAKALDTKQAYAQQKLTEAQEAEASGVASEEKLSQYEAELKTLDREIRDSLMEAEKKLGQKRRELMEPVVAKLQGTIKGVGEREGYSFDSALRSGRTRSHEAHPERARHRLAQGGEVNPRNSRRAARPSVGSKCSGAREPDLVRNRKDHESNPTFARRSPGVALISAERVSETRSPAEWGDTECSRRR
jgi:outer membrane protein